VTEPALTMGSGFRTLTLSEAEDTGVVVVAALMVTE
jgi:hypothetical protein